MCKDEVKDLPEHTHWPRPSSRVRPEHRGRSQHHRTDVGKRQQETGRGSTMWLPT